MVHTYIVTNIYLNKLHIFLKMNIDWNKLSKIVNKSNKIVLSTHINPDGDGLGSEVAMYHYIKSYNNGLNAISFGVGFNFGFSFLDISIQNFNLKDSKKIFNSVLNNNFLIKNESTRIVATYTVNL